MKQYKSRLVVGFCCLLAIILSFAAYGANKKIARIHAQIIAQTPLYDDPDLAAYVTDIGTRLGKKSNTPEVDFKFFVLDDPGINAFTPGYGYIYINRGLITYMTSEAQLAAVLAHEIAHNTERHLQRGRTAEIWNAIASTVASILANNSAVGSSLSLANQTRLKGFGRERELEADERGAEYMYRANYDPEEMLGMLGILKDNERFRDLQSIQSGGDATYHGVFQSHPRSDKRLQEVVLKAGSLPPGESYVGRDTMREMLEGVVVGTNYNGNKVKGYERFLNKNLGITFLYPETWTQTVKGSKIILKDRDKTVQLKLEVEKTEDKTLSSEKILTTKYTDKLSNVEPLHKLQKGQKQQARDYGTTARRDQQRVAAVTVGRNTFYFQGITKNNQLSEEQDKLFLDIIRTFRRATRKDFPPDDIKTITYKRLEPGQTFSDLAAKKELGTFTEQYLRMMNGYYPKGEPEPGTWIKVVKSGPIEESDTQ